MAIEADFRSCVAALDDVVNEFLEARNRCAGLSEYESDNAAFQLMEAVFRNVNAVSGIAVMPEPGSHLFPAWVLLRSAFEISLTAYWLTKEDDWKEREARWLGWMAGEETYQKKIANELRPVIGTGADEYISYAGQLEQRRHAIMQKLPKDSRMNRPIVPTMLKECGMDQQFYVAYRIGSHLSHGGPTVLRELFIQEDGALRRKHVNYEAWVEPFRMAGWSIAQSGSTVLARLGAPTNAVEQLVAAHDRLLSASSSLRS